MNSINLISKINAVKLRRGLSKAKKAETLVRAQCAGNFVIMPKPVSYARSLGNIAAFEGFAVGMLAISKDFKELAPIFFGGGAFLRHVCLSKHKEAIKQAAHASEQLLEQGFSPKEIKFVTNKIMSRNGNIVYSNLFRALYPKRMQKISQGIETRSGFLHVPFDRIGNALKPEKIATK